MRRISNTYFDTILDFSAAPYMIIKGNNFRYENEEIPQAGWSVMPSDVVKKIGNEYLSIDDLTQLTSTCQFFNRHLKQVLTRKQANMFKELIQAIIDDNRPCVKKILDAQPSL